MESKAFEARFDDTIKEVLVVTETGIYAEKVGHEKLWRANVTILAMLDVATGEIIENKKNLTWLMTDEQCSTVEKIFDIEKEKIYRLKVQESLACKNEFLGMISEIERGATLWVREVIERDCHDERLESILAKFQKPATLHVEGCQELVLDKALGMFSGEGVWNGCECFIHLDTDGEGAETTKDALTTWNKLLENGAEWDKRAREYAAKELTMHVDEWSENDAEENKNMIKEAFAKRMILSEVCVSATDDFEIYYADNMFWGNMIVVGGNMAEGINYATMAG